MPQQQHHHDRRRRIASLAALATFLLVLGSLTVPTAQATLFLAPATSVLPLSSIDSLTTACTTAKAGSTPYAMYSSGVKSEVNELLANASVTQVYVAATFVAGKGWAWMVTQLGETTPYDMAASEFVGNALPSDTAGPFVAYDSTQSGMLPVTGTQNYKVLCDILNMTKVPSAKKSFPWWAILIIVLAVVVILAVVLTIVLCCCCRKKGSYTDADDESSFASSSRSSGSFSTRSTSFSGSSSCATSRSSHSRSSRTSSAASSSASGSESESHSESQSDTSSRSSQSRSTSSSISQHQ